MTKRKKQIEILGFTKASNLLPKDKKIDNKNTPLKTNVDNGKLQENTPTKKTINEESNEMISVNNTMNDQNGEN